MSMAATATVTTGIAPTLLAIELTPPVIAKGSFINWEVVMTSRSMF